jgi:hypothetical protein
MFRFRSNGMAIRCLLSWTFDRLAVPPTFRPIPRIESHRAVPADASGRVSSGPASRPDERLSLHTAEAARRTLSRRVRGSPTMQSSPRIGLSRGSRWKPTAPLRARSTHWACHQRAIHSSHDSKRTNTTLAATCARSRPAGSCGSRGTACSFANAGPDLVQVLAWPSPAGWRGCSPSRPCTCRRSLARPIQTCSTRSAPATAPPRSDHRSAPRTPQATVAGLKTVSSTVL